MLFNKSLQNLEEVHNEDKLIDQLLQTFNIIKSRHGPPSKGISIDDSSNKVNEPHSQDPELLKNKTFSNFHSISKEVTGNNKVNKEIVSTESVSVS